MLEKEIPVEEIRNTLFHMKANKALTLMVFQLTFSSMPGVQGSIIILYIYFF